VTLVAKLESQAQVATVKGNFTMTTSTVANPPSFLQDLHDDHFRTAVAQVAATMEKPEYGDRLQKAVTLVLSHRVSLHDDGTATVQSGNRTYELTPECTCEDAQRRSKYCKHFLSVELLKQTSRRLHPSSNGHQPASPSQPKPVASQAACWSVHEAPASCCIKFHLHGVEILYTMRDVDDDTLYARVRRILPKILAKTNKGTNGTSSTNGTEPAQPDKNHCPIHGVPLKRQQKNGRSWWSHKTPQGWCQGK
jgi:hypothetical protein